MNPDKNTGKIHLQFFLYDVREKVRINLMLFRRFLCSVLALALAWGVPISGIDPERDTSRKDAGLIPFRVVEVEGHDLTDCVGEDLPWVVLEELTSELEDIIEPRDDFEDDKSISS